MYNHHDKDGLNLGRRRFVIGSLGVLAAPIVALLPRSAQAAAKKIDLPAPGPYDTCPVCGMFPARYPDWIATVLYKDGHADHFDGTKDFFKYLLNMNKYAKGRNKEEIIGLGVTDYYTTERIDARDAIYVFGSDVLGPMGHDLVPHPSEADAAEFSRDHAAKGRIRFNQVTLPLLAGLDNGTFAAQ